MPLSLQNLRDICDIINNEIQKSEFSNQITIYPSDISRSTQFPGLIQWQNVNNPLSVLLGQLATNKYFDHGMFYHFKGFDRAIDIIQNKHIQVSSLLSNSSNDFAEYSEFLKRLGILHPFIPKNIIWQRLTRQFNPSAKRPVDDDRTRILILCFVNNCHNERFWKEYASDDTGVCLGFRFKSFHTPPSDLFDLRSIHYDTGYQFDFINEINFKLNEKYKRILLINGLTKFAKFYKRQKYSWENETRLAFHYSKGTLGLYNTLKNLFPINFDRNYGRAYINLPLYGNPQQNPLFELTIDEVICGKNIYAVDYQRILQLTNFSYPSAKVWKRQ